MLRVTTLFAATAGATAEYYTRYLTDADGELPGRWVGRQADLLGLSGVVTTEALEALLSGHDPVTGEVLGNPLVDRARSDGRVTRAVAGFDATLSAPKSLSVWWALTGDDGLAECHDVAVNAVVDAVERFGATTRIRSNGRRLHPDTNGLSVAVFRQTTSRLDDPQLHSHVVISAKVQTDDGRWLALDARVLKGYQRALGGLYQSVLRAELTSRYGVVFDEIEKGQAEISGVPGVLLERFSKRTAQVDAAFGSKLAAFYVREGRDPTPKERGALGRQAAVDTRTHKSGHGVTDLRSRWLTEAADIGISPASLADGIADAAQREPAVAVPLDVAGVLGELGERRSAWHRFDVLQAICDTTPAQPDINGTDWATELHQATDTVLADGVDLDPDDDTSRRRRSDGRSTWIEPSARHVTTPDILRQEHHIVDWAHHATLEPSSASNSINAEGLDAGQADAAAVVAGHDRLVLVVGPAGAGKTTMLAAATQHLHGDGRTVFGLAPTAKAARTLETETAMSADTVAKLLYEWRQPDRPPRQRWRLEAGTTVVVDEAGMLDTADLYHLTQLAEVNSWRLVLVGDPHQLQAVGRGGMFHELVHANPHTELDTIHRFTHPWETAASLQLRHADTAALQIYAANGRIHAAPLAEHIDTITEQWVAAFHRNHHLSVTTTTNDHVHLINTAIQQRREELGELGDARAIANGVVVQVGDVIVTRRNERNLTTSTGDSVRNRDHWTIDHIHPNGDLQVTRLDEHGTVLLPAAYAAKHVQLGYAATEPGNQSDTTEASITLATAATTRRGLYVGATRGRHDNQILVACDTHNIDDAIDTLTTVLAHDRADLPATTIRRDLATMPAPTPTRRPRCVIPDWFPTIRQQLTDQLDHARTNHTANAAAIALNEDRTDELQQQLDQLNIICRPHDRALANAQHTADITALELQDARTTLHEHPRRGRRHARLHFRQVLERCDAAAGALQQIKRETPPEHRQRIEMSNELHRHTHLARSIQRTMDTTSQRTNNPDTIEQRLHALDTWHHWATGHPTNTDELTDTAAALGASPDTQHRHLADQLDNWIHEHHPHHPRPTPPPQPTPPAVNIEL